MIEKISNLLVEGIQEREDQFNIPLVINQANSIFYVMFTTADSVSLYSEFMDRDIDHYNKCAAVLMERYVIVKPNGVCYVSLAHDEKDVKNTLSAVKNALRCL